MSNESPTSTKSPSDNAKGLHSTVSPLSIKRPIWSFSATTQWPLRTSHLFSGSSTTVIALTGASTPPFTYSIFVIALVMMQSSTYFGENPPLKVHDLTRLLDAFDKVFWASDRIMNQLAHMSYGGLKHLPWPGMAA
jgi:hypothetical protein